MSVESVLKKRELIKDNSTLLPSYRPRKVVAREPEEDDLALSIRPLKNNQLANHVLLIGPPGTGKTVLCRYVLDYLADTYGVPYVYIIGEHTPNAILHTIAEEVGCTGMREKEAYGELFNYLEGFLRAGDRRIAVVLDEMELILNKAGKRLLFLLTRSEYMTIIGITNNQKKLLALDDPKIQSCFIPHVIHFAPYDANQLRDILEQRVKAAFYTGVVENETVPLIAALVAQDTGDARHALIYLEICAKLAQEGGASTITEEHVRQAERLVKREYFLAPLSRLSRPEKLLYYVILHELRENPSVARGVAYDKYNAFSKGQYERTYSRRTLSERLRKLEDQGLITTFRQYKEGVEWMIRTPEEIDEEAVLERLEEILQGG